MEQAMPLQIQRTRKRQNQKSRNKLFIFQCELYEINSFKDDELCWEKFSMDALNSCLNAFLHALTVVSYAVAVMIIKYGCSGSLFLPNRLLLSLYFAFITSCAAYLEHRCYSCMSLAFKEKWYFLSDTYFAPLNFTDDCDEPMKNGKIGTVSCNSACMMISEASYVGGQFTGFNYIRGCIHKIARKGFNNVTIYKMGLERRNICHRVSRSQLFRSHSYMEDQVTACICYGNECNGAKAIRNSCSKKMLHHSVYFVASIILFIILYESMKI
ncbi:hypothetical protein T11_3145 [Trichinella zimbabwensis]|uniref:Protein quiver n=1 Tax=Trichinella zimbabwensis TaxID=268475 RepID=A0A0V1GV24_9BILA|nr:hypothetical protein T11_3145 [Trichinella zimbabwensis]